MKDTLNNVAPAEITEIVYVLGDLTNVPAHEVVLAEVVETVTSPATVKDLVACNDFAADEVAYDVQAGFGPYSMVDYFTQGTLAVVMLRKADDYEIEDREAAADAHRAEVARDNADERAMLQARYGNDW